MMGRSLRLACICMVLFVFVVGMSCGLNVNTDGLSDSSARLLRRMAANIHTFFTQNEAQLYSSSSNSSSPGVVVPSLSDPGMSCSLGNIDLSSAESTTDISGSDVEGSDSYYYYMNLCGYVNYPPCNNYFQTTRSSICQVANNMPPAGCASSVPYCYNFGFFSSNSPSYSLIQGNQGIIATFTNGDWCQYSSSNKKVRTFILTLNCATTASSSFKMVADDPSLQDCTFHTTYSLPQACPGYSPSGSSSSGGYIPNQDNSGGSSGLSGGWIFIIVLAVTVPLYVVLGCTYNRKKQNKEGFDACPNAAFWRDLPGLAKDGCVFTFRKLRSLCDKSGSSTKFDQF